MQPFYPNLQGELYKSVGVNSSTDAQKVGSDLLKSYLKAYATVVAAAAPIEEAILGAVGFVAKEVGLGVKVENTLRKSATTLAKVEESNKVSPNVQNVLNTISDLKKSGTEVKVNPLKAADKQELNMTFKNKDGSKLDLRVETHEIPKSLGGKGDVPQRHLNADVYNSSGNRVKMKHINGGHKVLE